MHPCRQQLLRNAVVSDQHRRPFPQIQYLLNGHQDLQIDALPALPLGFALHEELIADDVVQCIRIILKIKDHIGQDNSNFPTIEKIQASIEARLVFREQCGKDFGPIAECCRIAVYIVSYMTSLGTWQSTFVPFRLAEKLLSYLERTKLTEIWRYRRDLLLWLLLVGASAGGGRNCFAVSLATRYRDFLERVRQDVQSWNDLRNGPKVLHNTMKSFLYADDWVANRHWIPAWTELERAVFLCGSDDVDIDVYAAALLHELVPGTNLFE